ncbi:MAG: IS200/IS605 family transposase [Desulfuromusa sp.]
MASTLTNLIYHVVFSTKGREPMIVPSIRDELYRYIGGIVKNEGGIMLEIGGMPDHLHLVVKLKPTHELSKIMQKIKGNTSKWINGQGKLKDRFSWQDGYGAFSVSESQVPIVIRYVKNQETHHRKLSFKGEFIQILERNQVEYEERYLWT